MTRVLTSIKGRRFGLDSDGKAVSPGGFRSGDHGSQFDTPSPGRIVLFDDFLGDLIADEWNLVEGTDSATSSEAILAGGIGGVLRFTTGDAGTGLAADLAQMTAALQWQASNGDLAFQTRLKVGRITDAYFFLGFTDVVTLEAPIISAGSADTITTTATDAVGFMFDTRMTTDNWWLVGVATDVDATLQNSGVAPVADDYATFRVEVTSAGVATFYINGIQKGTAMTGAVTAAADLTPTVAFGNLSGTVSIVADVDYVHVGMDRAADGDAT